MTLFRVLLTHSPRTGAEVFIPWDKTRLVSALSCWSSSFTFWLLDGTTMPLLEEVDTRGTEIGVPWKQTKATTAQTSGSP